MSIKKIASFFSPQRLKSAFRKSRSRPKTNKERGDELEDRVVELYKLLGKRNVQKNVVLKDKYGNISQIDVTYGLFPWTKRYIECKNYTNLPVPLKDVAKFKSVLQLNRISPRRGIFITTSTYVPRATTIGIKCYTGEDLIRLEQKAEFRARWRWLYRLALVLAIASAIYYATQNPQQVRTMAASARQKTHEVQAETLRRWNQTKRVVQDQIRRWRQ